MTVLLAATALSCGKKSSEEKAQKELADTLRKIDSINAYRAKYNDSIRELNRRNLYRDYSGNHRFKHSEIDAEGSVKFSNTGRDEYELSGSIISGKNSVQISGKAELVTEKYLNFEGKITQKINGKTYERNRKTSFKNEGKGNFWRLQDKVNSDGFVEYIDIYF